MICPKCGSNIEENLKFCPYCGSKVTSLEESTIEVADMEPDYNRYSSDSMAPKKSSGKGKILGVSVGAILLVVLIGCVFAKGSISNFIHRTFDSPQKYYRYTEEKELEKVGETYLSIYDVYRENLLAKDGRSASVKVELGTALKTLLDLAQIDIGNIENYEIEIEEGKKGNDNLLQVNSKINDKSILSVNAIMNLKDQKMYFQVPELTKSYMDISTSIQEATAQQGMNDYMKQVDMLQKAIPETKDVEKLYNNLTDSYLENVSNVTKEKQTITAGDVKEDCTELKVTYDNESTKAILKAMLAVIKEDGCIKKVFDATEQTNQYQQMLTTLEEALKEIDKQDLSDIGLEMRVYVNKNSEIIGRDFIMNHEAYAISYRMPRKKDKFGFVLKASSGTENINYFNISGSGTIKNDKMNGEFSYTIDPSLNPNQQYISSTKDLLNIDVKDFDLSSLKKGYANGTIELKTKAVPTLDGYSLKMDLETKKDHAKGTISAQNRGDNLISMSFESKKGKAPDISAPSDTDTLYDMSNSTDSLAYVQEIDFNKFFEKIKTDTGLDINNIMNSIYGYINPYGNLNYNTDYNDLYNLDDYSDYSY